MKNITNFRRFWVQAAHDCHMCFTTCDGESDNILEVFIGGWEGEHSAIRYNKGELFYRRWEGGACCYLYTNMVLGGSVGPSVCSSALETALPLSNFQTKHIFGILMALR